MNAFLGSRIIELLGAGCNLRKLSLVQCYLNENDVAEICRIISGSRFLIDLDLSWNELNDRSMVCITSELATNRKLQYVNLSWNFLNKHSYGPFDRLKEDESD
jgi:Ran GTPase-activating protein (RanGAP) involved in mRNA processing and transport